MPESPAQRNRLLDEEMGDKFCDLSQAALHEQVIPVSEGMQELLQNG